MFKLFNITKNKKLGTFPDLLSAIQHAEETGKEEGERFKIIKQNNGDILLGIRWMGENICWRLEKRNTTSKGRGRDNLFRKLWNKI